MLTNRLAVILVNYNDSRYLINIIRKMAMQHPDELIIVDDCSTDKSTELVKCMQKSYPTMRLIQSPVNGGPFRAFIRGVESTNCEYVSCWSCDDDPLPGYVRHMTQAINDFPFVDVFTCNTQVEREGVIYERTALPFDAYVSPDYLFRIAKTKGISAINVIGSVLRREHILECWAAGGDKLKTHFDAMYVFFAAFKTGMVILGDYLTLYRANLKGFGSSRAIKDNVNSVRRIREMLRLFPQAKLYLDRLNIWDDDKTIIATRILQLLPRVPKLIRRMIYKKVYARTF